MLAAGHGLGVGVSPLATEGPGSKVLQGQSRENRNDPLLATRSWWAVQKYSF